MEYGWNRVVDSRGPPISEEDPLREPDRSDAISVRSSRSRYAASIRSAHSPWADRLFINDWKQPLHPTVPSMHDEETQLEALQKHVVYLSTDLQEHNELRAPMATLVSILFLANLDSSLFFLQYTPRSTNASKSLTNWENKSKYLLSEIVKYQSYIDSLQNAMALRLKKRGEKALERALRKDDDDERLWTVHPDDETVQDHGELPRDRSESDLITPTATLTRLHHREVAQGGEDDYHDV
jgi:PH/SEC7 domain-containing protein